jgi:hypothetical protein
MTNALAYYRKELITGVKGLIVQARITLTCSVSFKVGHISNTFTVVIYVCRNKLTCLSLSLLQLFLAPSECKISLTMQTR